MRTYAVTGANGYLGSFLCQFIKQQNCRVISLQRSRNDKGAGENSGFFSLKHLPSPQVFKGAEVLVHCAYDPIPVSWKDISEVNVQGSIRLLQAAQAGGIKQIIYISSISAFDNCNSLYGQAKLEIEKEVVRLGGAIIRPGLIFGAKLGGFLASLKSLAIRLPVIPLIGKGDQTLYFSHIEDLCELIFELSSKPDIFPFTPITAASEKGKTFREILTTLAHQENKSPLLIPVPWKIFWMSLKILEGAGIRMGFRSDSVISLVHQNPHPDFSVIKELSASFRNFD